MRFAILGDHPDGWAVAQALAATGRHELLVYQGATPHEVARQIAPEVRHETDIEEVLADPQVEAVIVATSPATRLDVLRRVLQSDRSASCVHPVDRKSDGGHEINLLQGDVHRVVIPILWEAVQTDLLRLRKRLSQLSTAKGYGLIDLEVGRPGDILFPNGSDTDQPTFPGWTLLRRLGGEIAEVEALAVGEEVVKGETVLVQGRFLGGGLFRALYQPNSQERTRLRIIGPGGHDEIVSDLMAGGIWAAIAERFETAIAELPQTPRAAPGAGRSVTDPDVLNWLDEVRCLELDDAARRSIARRRATDLDYQEATEEVGFKGTMTLVGCGLLWVVMLLLLLSAWFPALRWTIAPVVFGFLALQAFRWLVPAKDAAAKRE